ncbi:MAG: glycosyltransferase [Nitrospirota bacterium]
MRVLLSTYYNARFPAMNEHVEATLRRMGHDVAVFEHYAYAAPGRLRDRLPRLQRWDVGRLNRLLLRRSDEIRPDLLLVLGGVTIQPETLGALRRRSVTVTNWFGDYPAHFDYTMAVAPHYDYFFVSDSLSRDRHQAAGHRHVHWLPFGCLPEWANGTEEKRDAVASDFIAGDSDVIFVGSWYPEREAFLEQLARDCRLAIWGPGWERAARGPLRERIRGGALRAEQWRRLYQRTPITLNLHYGFGGPAESYGAMANTRVFEALAAGGFLVSDEKKDLAALLSAGREFIGFHDLRECSEKIRYYADHPAERRAIAGHGQRAVLAGHTYEHRLRHLLTIAGGRG